MNYNEKHCPFCPMFKDSDASYIIITPLNPVTEGHKLVIPREHEKDFTESLHVSKYLFYYASKWAKENIKEDVNLITSKGVYATQTVGHLHIHLIPRRKDDNLHLPWTNQK